MNHIQDGIENSEYNNIAGLIDVNENGVPEQLLGALRSMNPVKQAAVLSRLATPPPASKGSRAEMEKHFQLLPAHVKSQLVNGDLRLADTLVYSIKPITSKTVKMFEPQDAKEVGLRTISEARLPKNSVLLVSGIILLAGTAPGATKDDQMRTPLNGIETIPALVNGEFSLKANKKIIVPEGTSNRVFATGNYMGVPLGYYKLSNPRLIHDDVSIEFTVELGTQTGIPANAQFFVGLHGTITTP
jgi:hypothetical protein